MTTNTANTTQVRSTAAPQATVEANRAKLQAMLLRKTLETQQQQVESAQREAEGKGLVVDIRV